MINLYYPNHYFNNDLESIGNIVDFTSNGTTNIVNNTRTCIGYFNITEPGIYFLNPVVRWENDINGATCTIYINTIVNDSSLPQFSLPSFTTSNTIYCGYTVASLVQNALFVNNFTGVGKYYMWVIHNKGTNVNIYPNWSRLRKIK